MSLNWKSVMVCCCLATIFELIRAHPCWILPAPNMAHTLLTATHIHGGATTTGPDATHPPAICQNSGGGGGGGGSWGGVQPGVGGGGQAGGRGGGGWPGVRGESSQG